MNFNNKKTRRIIAIVIMVVIIAILWYSHKAKGYGRIRWLQEVREREIKKANGCRG